MLLRELANTSYSFRHEIEQSDNSKTHLYYFDNKKIKFEVAIDINVSPNGKNKQFEVRFRAKPIQDDKILRLGKEWEWSDSITGTGDSIKVFSTILKIMKDAISENDDVTEMIFSAKESEPSRVKLYSRFVDNLSKYLTGWKLRGVKQKANTLIYFLEKQS